MLPVWFIAAALTAATPPKIVKGPWVQHVTPTSAMVRVEVTPAAAVALDLGDGQHAVQDSEVTTLHSLHIDTLTPATKYTYSVKAGATTKQASFTTAPPEASTAPLHFLVYGDNRTDDAAHAAVVRQMTPVPSDFIIQTGDLVENGSNLAQWQTFFDIEAPLLDQRCIWSAVGNHELVDGSGINYVKFFGPALATKPQHLDDTFRWGNTRFFLINGISSFKPGTVERTWLDKVLADADGEADLVWRIVVVHHGPWSSGPHGGNPRFHDAGLPALLKQHKIDIIFSGHDHTYERGVGEGLPFVVTGGGGAPLYKLKKRIPESRKSESVHHFVDAEATPTTLTLTAIRSDGSRIERCALSKLEPGWFCGLPDASTPPADGGAPDLGPREADGPPPTKPTSRCSCDVVGARTRGGFALGAFALMLPVVAYARRRRPY